MAQSVCLECGAEMPYDWALCPNCGWKAPDAWDRDGEADREIKNSPAFLSKPRPWIGTTVWILLGVLMSGLVVAVLRH
ncbi:MAG TPA: hypothetical protein VK859_12085 [bacterium]|nr:hypothetical protein [bacterium]